MMSSANDQLQTLDVMTLPLHGERLIEASAGTGKTYTIAGLYIRLLLGHGNDGSCHQQPLSVDQILVVTFTEAATAELRDRIRSRIVLARHAFLAGSSDDPLMKQLLVDLPDHPGCASLLLQALRQMDEAAIFTIHGFCQRMLTQHAFESGSYFETEFITDESALRQQVVEDYWRDNFYATSEPIDYTLATIVRSYWPSPEKLLAQISNLLSNPFLVVSGDEDNVEIKEYLAKQLARIDDVKAQWNKVSDEVIATITSKAVDKRSYSAKNLPKWFDEVNTWAQSETSNLKLPKTLNRFSDQMLIEKTKQGEPPSLGVFSAIDTLLGSVPSLKEMLLARALSYVKTHVARHKKQAALLSFDDLLSGLATSLDGNKEGNLAGRIRTQYPLAMIDEFQDTDLLQYQIFNTIYGEQKRSGLLMIGDPKQAIYGFRGADIFTYIAARRKIANHYTLGTNYRSSADMVSGVNRLFEQSDAPFIYHQDIGFNAVDYIARNNQFEVDGQAKGAITQWLLPTDSTVSSTEYLQVMALACASEINNLLTRGQQDNAGFRSDKGFSPVVASDIAILVRTGREAKLVKQELSKQGISSVYLSNRESVFAAEISTDVWHVLQAVNDPSNARLLRTAMATSMMGLDITELEKLNNDESTWQRHVDLFNYFNQRWHHVGVLAMLRELIHQQSIPEKLLRKVDGERQLTDLLHIGELLEQQSLEIQGEHALIHWLADKISSTLQDNQEQQLRLESDKDLVQIVTIHKSKGLEYNLVFLPFICAIRQAKQALYHQDGKTIIDLSNGEEGIGLADKERLAEDLRLLYVAITRAVHHCWLGMAPLKSGRATKDNRTDLHKSAIGYLLLGREINNSQALSDKLNQLAASYPYFCIAPPPNEPLPPYHAPSSQVVDTGARKFNQIIENNYWITSYSALSKDRQHDTKVTVDASEEVFDMDMETVDESIEHPTLEETPEYSIFTFPRGAHAGTFLHLLFEEIDFSCQDSQARRLQVASLLEDSEFDSCWLDVLLKLIDDVLNSELSPALYLSQLGMQDKLVEMEFFLPITGLECQALNQLLIKHDPLSKQAPQLSFSRIKGMLKGFIDLVFVKDNRYYVLDYKSNHLGDSVDDYNSAAMTDAMIDHRYDFQYQLYSLALHRFLQTRLVDYDFEQHFGGVYYLFLRGMDKTNQQRQGIFYNRPSHAFIEQLDELFTQELSNIGSEETA